MHWSDGQSHVPTHPNGSKGLLGSGDSRTGPKAPRELLLSTGCMGRETQSCPNSRPFQGTQHPCLHPFLRSKRGGSTTSARSPGSWPGWAAQERQEQWGHRLRESDQAPQCHQWHILPPERCQAPQSTPRFGSRPLHSQSPAAAGGGQGRPARRDLGTRRTQEPARVQEDEASKKGSAHFQA